MCTSIWRAFAVLYVLALAIYLIGLFGLFGQQPDPLSGIFLIPRGMPWVFLSDAAPTYLLPWLAAIAPAMNLLLLISLCRLVGQTKGHG